MKKSTLMLSLFIIGIYAAPMVWAEEMEMQSEERGERQGMSEGKGMGMKGPMMKGMHQPTMIATTDGGVIVLSGPKLAKYDANLNLVKEVELKHDKKGPAPQEKMTPPPAPEEPKVEAIAEEAAVAAMDAAEPPAQQ